MLAGILWGCMGIMVRDMKAIGFESMEIVSFRAVTTSVLMVIILLFTNRKAFRIKLKDIWCFIGTGILSVVFFNVCYFSAMSYTTLGVAAILLYTAPTFVAIMSFFLFREKFGINKLICLILAFAGCVMVSGGFSFSELSVKGLLLGLGAGFGYALYSIFGRYAINRGYGSFTITVYTFIFAFIGTIPFIDLSHFTNLIANNTSKMPYDILLVIFNTVIAYIVYTKGLSGMENGMASIIASIEPVVATLVGVIIYKEKLTVFASSGIILVLMACVLGQIKIKKPGSLPKGQGEQK